MNEANSYLLMVLLGQVVPQLSDLINKHVPSANIRFLSSLLVSSVIAIALNFNRLAFGSVEEALVSGLVIWASSQGAYQFYYGGSSYQQGILYNASNFPLKALVPPVEKLAPKLAELKSTLVSSLR